MVTFGRLAKGSREAASEGTTVLHIRCCSLSNISIHLDQHSEAATGGVLWKEVFLKVLQNSQEKIFARVSFLTNLQA